LEELRGANRLGQVIAKRVASAGAIEQSVKAAADALAQATQNVGLATLAENMYFTGLSHLFGQPEFMASHQALEAARLLDSLDEWLSEAAPSQRLSVYIGHENPVGKASGCSLIIARFSSALSDHSYIGVLGPTRQSYPQVINLVEYAAELLEESLT
jgi:heat-inducible transcriptional repressor